MAKRAKINVFPLVCQIINFRHIKLYDHTWFVRREGEMDTNIGGKVIPRDSWCWGDREEGCVQLLALSHLFGLFLFNIRKAEQTRGFSVEPVKLVLSSLGLFSRVLFGKLAIQRSACSGSVLLQAWVLEAGCKQPPPPPQTLNGSLSWARTQGRRLSLHSMLNFKATLFYAPFTGSSKTRLLFLSPLANSLLGKRPSAWPGGGDWVCCWLPICGSGRELGFLTAVIWVLNSVRPQTFWVCAVELSVQACWERKERRNSFWSLAAYRYIRHGRQPVGKAGAIRHHMCWHFLKQQWGVFLRE